MLNLKQIRELWHGANIQVRIYHADLLNSDHPMDLPEIATKYWEASKIHEQADNLVKSLNSLSEKLSAFVEGNFDKYIDQHNKFREDENDQFDPYMELLYSMNDGDWLYSLPTDINRYAELVWFQQTNSARRKLQNEALKNSFPGLEWGILATDENGDNVLVSEKNLPSDIVNQIECNREIADIQVEYCLDNYNSWHAAMIKMIVDRRPFIDMLSLLKS